MEMNSPVGANALDAQGIVGKPLDRVDGRLKVTGGAHYAYEMQQNTLYGFVVEASIGKGTIKSIDTRAAEKAPGVVLVLTHRNAPEQGTGNHREAHPVLTGPEVTRYGQPVGFVVAEKAPGVVLVLTHRNAPEQGTGNHREAHPVLTGPEVTRYGQPVGFVVAESFEQARA